MESGEERATHRQTESEPDEEERSSMIRQVKTVQAEKSVGCAPPIQSVFLPVVSDPLVERKSSQLPLVDVDLEYSWNLPDEFGMADSEELENLMGLSHHPKMSRSASDTDEVEVAINDVQMFG